MHLRAVAAKAGVVTRPGTDRTLDLLFGGFILLLAAVAFAGAVLLPPDIAGTVEAGAHPPSPEHLLGTDTLGRDLLGRLLQGMRTTIAIGVTASVLAVAAGTLYGGVAGLARPRADEAMMRGVDVALALPYMFIVILLVSLVDERGFWLIAVVLGCVEWLPLSRIIRAGVRDLRHEAYVESARIMGGGRFYLLRAHLIPQLVAPLAVYATLMLPVVMMQEAFLSFLGLGVPPPTASWGSLIAEGVRRLETAPWILLAATGSLAIWLICLHAAGDRLARRLGLEAAR